MPLTICDLAAISRPAAPAPWFSDASCSCTSCSPTGFRLHDEAVRRPASAPSSRQEMLRPPLSCAGSHGSSARLHCWFGFSPNAQRESHSRSVPPQYHFFGKKCIPRRHAHTLTAWDVFSSTCMLRPKMFLFATSERKNLRGLLTRWQSADVASANWIMVKKLV